MDISQLKLNPTNLYIFQDYIENLNPKAGTENEARTREEILKQIHEYKNAQNSYTEITRNQAKKINKANETTRRLAGH